MGYRGQGGGNSFQSLMPLTRVVKILIIANTAIWLVGQVILERFILKDGGFTSLFGLIPALVLDRYYVWQPLTYMFLHSIANPTHILFNMLLLWWLGSELESRWGTKFFTIYYFVCGLGAAILYMLTVFVYALYSGNMQPLLNPVIGASGAIFGLMMAYAIVFGERVMLFMFMFPMKAKFFVLILGVMELMFVVNNGIAESQEANLAHLGGLVTGFCFLIGWAQFQKIQRRRASQTSGRKLRLVVDNKKDPKPQGPKGPKYWN